MQDSVKRNTIKTDPLNARALGAVMDLLRWVGEDPSREGLRETPDRVINAWKEWCSGYDADPTSILKTFEDGAEGYDEIVCVNNIEIFSHCEHHLAPFFGVCHIGYIPNKRIVGLSKLARLAEVYSRRLQVQERLTTQIAKTIQEVLDPKGVGVVIKARHLCMCSRGVQKTQSDTTTSALLGALRDEPEARAEFFRLTLG